VIRFIPTGVGKLCVKGYKTIALLKRGIMGSFHHVSEEHLDRYANEFAFRWNNRKITDGERAVTAIRGIEGKRLYYRDPIRK
ncbi:MAG: transposase, partial [Thermoplasmata archaeon]|nr:transposase [Thermoplasmata archaeon]